MFRETVNAVPSALADATRVTVGNESPIPPFGDAVEKKVMDDAIAEGGGEDFPDDWFSGDKGDASRRNISAVNDTVSEVD